MILSRSPLRISIGGGGTDLPSYYNFHDGFVIAAAINKYVYVTITKPFAKGIYLKYSNIEKTNNIQEIKHPIIKEVLKRQEFLSDQIEITTLADVPSGTGLGSSGSFTSALIQALSHYNKKIISKKDIAELACHIEIDCLNEPVGKQDQYISTFGGIKCFTFKKNNEIIIEPLLISKKTISDLENNLLLFFTGFERSASTILSEQKKNSETKVIIDNLNYIKKLGYQIKNILEEGDIKSFGNILNEHWQYKKKRSKKMTNSNIDQLYNIGLENGAIGGKVVGAGGGGFLLFYAQDKNKLSNKMQSLGVEEMKFKFDNEGTKIVDI